MKERTTALLNLISYNAPLQKLVGELQPFPWDSDVDLVVLKSEHLQHVLRRYLNEELNEQHIEDWANAIECREDIGCELPYADVLQRVLHQLANPLLTEPLNHASATALLELLVRK